MASEFTYEVPDEKKYYQALITFLKNNSNEQLLEVIRNAKVSIAKTTSYSRKRWNAFYTEVIFHVPALQSAKVKGSSLLMA